MASKTARKKKVSSGVRRARAFRLGLGTNEPTRKRPVANPAVMSFLKHQARDRWPDQATSDRYAVLNRERGVKRPTGTRKPATFKFTFLEMAMTNSLTNLKKLLVAASLKVKVVKRHPGFVLQRTYNHGNRPIEII